MAVIPAFHSKSRSNFCSWLGIALVFNIAVLCSGCGTFIAHLGNDPADPRYVYLGVRADMDGIIYTNEGARRHFDQKNKNVSPVLDTIPNYPARICFGIVDLPFSLAGDTLLFPVEVGFAIDANRSDNRTFPSSPSNATHDRGHH